MNNPTLGVLAQYVLFEKHGLVKFPAYLSYEEAATLPCAASTAWYALHEDTTNPVGPHQTVLALGTGGVSIFALQFAIAAGAKVIITSSSDEKLAKARALGATGLVNYKKTPEWDKEVLKLTDGKGANQVVEVGGITTLPLSFNALAFGGQVHSVGMVAGDSQNPKFNIALATLFKGATLRGVMVGSRQTLEVVTKVLDAHQIKPVVDKVFPFEQALDALKYLESGSHFGKVVIQVE